MDSVVCFAKFIHLIVIYPVDSVIQPSNNWGQDILCFVEFDVAQVHCDLYICIYSIGLYYVGFRFEFYFAFFQIIVHVVNMGQQI